MTRQTDCLQEVCLLALFIVCTFFFFCLGSDSAEIRKEAEMRREMYENPTWVEAVIAEEHAKDMLKKLEKELGLERK